MNYRWSLSKLQRSGRICLHWVAGFAETLGHKLWTFVKKTRTYFELLLSYMTGGPEISANWKEAMVVSRSCNPSRQEQLTAKLEDREGIQSGTRIPQTKNYHWIHRRMDSVWRKWVSVLLLKKIHSRVSQDYPRSCTVPLQPHNFSYILYIIVRRH